MLFGVWAWQRGKVKQEVYRVTFWVPFLFTTSVRTSNRSDLGMMDLSKVSTSRLHQVTLLSTFTIHIKKALAYLPFLTHRKPSSTAFALLWGTNMAAPRHSYFVQAKAPIMEPICYTLSLGYICFCSRKQGWSASCSISCLQFSCYYWAWLTIRSWHGSSKPYFSHWSCASLKQVVSYLIVTTIVRNAKRWNALF